MAVKRLSDPGFLLLWVLANVLPWLAVCVLWAGVATAFTQNAFVNSGAFWLLGWCVVCGAVGTAQRAVLQLRLTGMGWWPVATVVGSGAVLFLFPLSDALPQLPTPVLIPLFLGGGIGVAQWWVLRRRVLRAWRWMVIQIVAAIASILAGLFTPGVDVVMGGMTEALMVVGSLIEVVAGLITGVGLLLLLRSSRG